MTGLVHRFAAATAIAVMASAGALAQAPNPACQRLEAQLASLDSGNADPARADQIRRAEEAVNRLQSDVDRQVAQARKMGCENSGFFSIFNTPPPQCGATSRSTSSAPLENMQMELEHLNGGTSERAAHTPGRF